MFNPNTPHGSYVAEIAGTNPASGTYRYEFNDLIQTVRRLRDQSKNSLASFEPTPYGETYASSGQLGSRSYTSHAWDAATQSYFAPYRSFDPDTARWLSRDPSGTADGLNLYGYARQNPTTHFDPTGQITVLMFLVILAIVVVVIVVVAIVINERYKRLREQNDQIARDVTDILITLTVPPYLYTPNKVHALGLVENQLLTFYEKNCTHQVTAREEVYQIYSPEEGWVTRSCPELWQIIVELRRHMADSGQAGDPESVYAAASIYTPNRRYFEKQMDFLATEIDLRSRGIF